MEYIVINRREGTLHVMLLSDATAHRFECAEDTYTIVPAPVSYTSHSVRRDSKGMFL